MNIRNFKIKDDPELLSYIEGMDINNVIFNDYFYFTLESFASSDTNNIYSEKQVARILNSTDKEYFELVQKYFSDELSANNPEAESQRLETQAKIDELNLKIQKSKDFENAEKKVKEIQLELEKLEKELKSYDGIHEKILTSQNDTRQYEAFSRFNLQKIHDDLVSINSQIDKLEEELISKKIVEIKENKNEFEYDSGKIGLALGIIIGVGIFGVVFQVLSLPLYVSVIIWIIGLVIGLFIILFSKTPKSIQNYESNDYSAGDIDNLLFNLKSQRQSILSLVGVKNTNEFFLAKARYTSQKKNLDYLQNMKADISTRINPIELQKKRDELQTQLAPLQSQLSDPTVLISPEKYLELYRELDSLKLQLGKSSAENVSKSEVPKKLAEIRKELSDKLPSYINVLKGTYQRSFDKIKTVLAEYSTKLGIPSTEITSELSEWNELSALQKFLIQLSMAKEVYVSNFVFILEETSNWRDEDQKQFGLFQEIMKDESFDLVLLDY